MKPRLSLDVLTSALYFYLPESWDDFSGNERIKDICTNKNFYGIVDDFPMEYLHFLGCTFQDCHFIGIEFTEISFVRCKFINCTFEGCKIKNSSLYETEFHECSFNISLQTTMIKELKPSDVMDLSKCFCEHLILDEKTITQTEFIFAETFMADKNLIGIETKNKRLVSYNEYLKLLSK